MRASGTAGISPVRYSASVLLVLGYLDDPNDLRRHKNGVAANRVGNRHLDRRPFVILFPALEAKAALGHVLAGDDIVGKSRPANASLVTDLGARMLAPVVQRRRRRALARRGIRRGSLLARRSDRACGSLHGRAGLDALRRGCGCG